MSSNHDRHTDSTLAQVIEILRSPHQPLKNTTSQTISAMAMDEEVSPPEEADHGDPPTQDNCVGPHDDPDPNISISSTAWVAGQTVAPFLAKHIPEQYAPLGGPENLLTKSKKNPNTKYCYRHRPDLKCRRTADEPSMENLQRDLETLSQSDQQGISHVWSLFSAAPSKHRNLMLQGILTQCCFPQLSYLSTAVRDLIRIDFIAALPAEVSYKILCYLDTTSLCKAAQVSQRWRTLADDDVVWHKMCEQHIDRKCTKCGWGLPLLERKRLRDWKRQQQLRATGRGLNEWSPLLTPYDSSQENEVAVIPSHSGKRNAVSLSPEAKRLRLSDDANSIKRLFRPWKDVYKDRFKVGTNWKYGRCTTKVFRGHTNGVMCLQFDDNILATGSYDSTIKIWDIETGEEIRTLHGHTSGIRALQFDDTKLISGSLDRTLKVWNWRTGECISTYRGHTEGVIAVHFEKNILASGSVDRMVKIWNFEDKSTFCLKGHRDWVNAVRVDSASRTVFSASDDCTVRLWDLDTKSCIKIFEGHVGQVQQVLPLPADYEPDLSMVDEDDASSTSSNPSDLNASTTTTNPSADDIRSSFGPAFASNPLRPLPPRYILTGALDSTVRLWDVYSSSPPSPHQDPLALPTTPHVPLTVRRSLKTLFGHVEGVWALAADTLRIISGSEDRMVKVWDARTGRCERTFTGHKGPVTCLGLSDSRLVSGGEDCEVRVYGFGYPGGKEGDGDQTPV